MKMIRLDEICQCTAAHLFYLICETNGKYCLYPIFSQMVGVEYILLHAQEPILYIIRKQQRQSPTQGEQHSILLNLQRLLIGVILHNIYFFYNIDQLYRNGHKNW